VKATIGNNRGEREQVTRSRKLHPRKVKEEHGRIYQAFTKGHGTRINRDTSVTFTSRHLVCREIFSIRASKNKKRNTGEEARAGLTSRALFFDKRMNERTITRHSRAKGGEREEASRNPAKRSIFRRNRNALASRKPHRDASRTKGDFVSRLIPFKMDTPLEDPLEDPGGCFDF